MTPFDTAASASRPEQARRELAGWRRTSMFVVGALAMLMGSIDQTIVATALPAIQHDLRARITWSSWTITMYALGQILSLPIAGALSDHYSRKRVFLTAIGVFTLASVCCGFAGNIYQLVPLRGLQGLAGGAFLPSGSGLISDHFGQSRDRALALFSSTFPIGGVVGPIFGGLFVTYWSWRWIFWVNAPVGIVLIVAGAVLIPTTRGTRTSRVDGVGLLLIAVILLSAMFGTASLGRSGTPLWDPRFVVSELLAIALVLVFLRHIRVAEAPVIPPMLLRGKGFAVMNSINLLFGSAALGFATLVPLYAQEHFKISSLSAGTLLTARAVGMIVVSSCAVWALRRTGYRWPMTLGFLVIASGLVAMSLTHVGPDAYRHLAIAGGVIGCGLGLSQPAANNAMLQLAPSKAGSVAGLRAMLRQIGAITGVSVTAAVAGRSNDPGAVLGHAFLVFAVILLVALPLIRRVPEHRGNW